MRRRAGGPVGGDDVDPFSVLGLSSGAGPDEVRSAWRRLAKQRHPDVGGSVEAMQLLNEAAEAALRLVRSDDRRPVSGRTSTRRPAPAGSTPVRHDHPSFTVEALPAETFEALLVVGAWLGDLVDDDPPYLAEFVLTGHLDGWCRLEIVPDAGASTVSLTVAPHRGRVAPDLDVVRNAFVEALNGLDWSTIPG